MNKTLIAGTIAALVSTGAFAAKPIKPEPAPDLTPRVEALEAEVDSLTTEVDALQTNDQAQDTRIQDVEDTLGYMQPGGSVSAVLVDATDKVVGVPYYEPMHESYYNNGQNGQALLKIDGRDLAFFIELLYDSKFYPTEQVYFMDSTCGDDGGQPLMRAYAALTPRVAKDQNGTWFIPDNVDYTIWEANSVWSERDTRCVVYSTGRNEYYRAASPVDLGVKFPVRVEFR